MRWIRTIMLFVATASCAQPHAEEKPASIKNFAVCFVYHRFGDGRYPTTNVPVADFESHLRFLKENGYHVVTLSQAIAYVQSAQPHRKTAVITIDDGYNSFFTNGLPLLKKYGMPATLFINTETVGAGDYMDWPSLKAAMVAGVEIGNHTHTHQFFLNLPASTRYETFRDEIDRSQQIIRKHLGIEPVLFAYPYGEFDARMKAVVKEAGFQYAAAQNSGVLFAGTDMLQIPRFPMSEAYSTPAKFKEKALMHPLDVASESPEDTQLSANLRPVLQLRIRSAGLQVSRMQCFVQGSQCKLSVVDTTNDFITVTMQSASDLSSRRRTLYTLTVPDSTGKWCWYSRLWINPKISDN